MRYLVFLSVILLIAATADAQTTYRWIDKTTGQTVYSDLPPPSDAQQVTATQDKTESSETSDLADLPYAIRIAAQNFPVTLYSATTCGDLCNEARGLLKGRRVPFTEIKLDELTEEDFQKTTGKLGGSKPTIPILMVGAQKIVGVQSDAWNSLLDLAGYPPSTATPAPSVASPSGSAP